MLCLGMSASVLMTRRSVALVRVRNHAVNLRIVFDVLQRVVA